jgi:hypothetical protein
MFGRQSRAARHLKRSAYSKTHFCAASLGSGGLIYNPAPSEGSGLGKELVTNQGLPAAAKNQSKSTEAEEDCGARFSMATLFWRGHLAFSLVFCTCARVAVVITTPWVGNSIHSYIDDE